MDKLRERDEQLATDFLYGTHEKPTIAQVMTLIRDVREAALRQQTPAVGAPAASGRELYAERPKPSTGAFPSDIDEAAALRREKLLL